MPIAQLTRKPPEMPDPSVPLVGRDGRLTDAWVLYLRRRAAWEKEVQSKIDEIAAAMP